MQLDVVNKENEKVGSVDVSDDLFGGRVNEHVMWESVVRANAAERRGTHQTKNRANVSGKAVLIDVAADDKLLRSIRNIPGVSLVPSARVSARAIIDARRVVVTKGALEKLQEALA